MEMEELFKQLKPVLRYRAEALSLEYHLNPETRRDIEGMKERRRYAMVRGLAERAPDDLLEKQKITPRRPSRCMRCNV
jgi:hypothetical protein